MAALVLRRQNPVAMKEIAWPLKPKACTTSPLTGPGLLTSSWDPPLARAEVRMNSNEKYCQSGKGSGKRSSGPKSTSDLWSLKERYTELEDAGEMNEPHGDLEEQVWGQEDSNLSWRVSAYPCVSSFSISSLVSPRSSLSLYRPVWCSTLR